MQSKFFLLLIASSALLNIAFAETAFLRPLQSAQQFGVNPQLIQASSLSDCKQKCLSDSNCNIVNYDDFGECYISSQKLENPTYCEECYSFEKAFMDFESVGNRDFLLEDFEHSASDVLACQNLCLNDPDCNVGLFLPDSNRCFLSEGSNEIGGQCGNCQGFKKVIYTNSGPNQPEPPVTPPTIDTNNFTSLGSRDFTLNGIIYDQINDFAGCQQACLSDSACDNGYFIYDGPNKGKCKLAYSKRLDSDLIEFTVGFQKKQTVLPEFNSLGGHDFNSNGVSQPATSDLDCQQKCLNDASCRLGIFVTAGNRFGECWLATQKRGTPILCGTPCHAFEKKVYNEFTALDAQDYNSSDSNRNVGPVNSLVECKEKCLENSACQVGIYVDSGNRQGECWIADSKRQNPIQCGTPCQPFEKN